MQRFTAALLAVGFTAALARTYEQCSPPGLPPAAKNDSITLNVLAINEIVVYVCTSATPADCTLGSSYVHSCDLPLMPGNATSYVTVTVQAASAVLAYHTSLPFSWHVIQGAQPVVVPWPTGSVDLGTAGDMYCDSNADCVPGVLCDTAKGTCNSLVPSPSSSPLPPAGVPSPSAGPAASMCNITGTWLQTSLTPKAHSADATIEIAFNGDGSFGFTCKKGRGTCPGGEAALNGSLTLSSKDNSLVLTPSGGAGVITGIINVTMPCLTGVQPSVMALTGGALQGSVEWTRQATPTPPTLDLTVNVATFLGQGAAQFVASGVAILSENAGSAVIAVAGNGQAAFGGLTPSVLFGAAADANGTIVVFAYSPVSGLKPTSVFKLGDRVDHIRANAKGNVAVAGSFGVAVLSGLASGSASVTWQDDMALIQPGTCGVCCSIVNSNTNVTCTVDIGDDGVLIVDYRAQSSEGWLWGLYSASGQPMAQHAVVGADLTAVAVDSINQQAMVSFFYDSETGKEPMVMPRVETFSYADARRVVEAWVDFPWDAHVYRQPGPCNGNVADGRVMSLRMGRDGTMLLGGRSDGGDTPYFCGMRNSSRIAPITSIDGFTQGYNMGAQAITDFLRVDPLTGETIVGQLQLTRLPSNQKGNTLLTLASQSDDAGNVYLLQSAGCCIANMENLTVNGVQTAQNVDATALHILDASLSKRHHWTHFIAEGSSGGGVPVDIDVRGGVVVVAMTTNAEMVTAQPLPGSGSNVGGEPVGYIVVLPTVAATTG